MPNLSALELQRVLAKVILEQLKFDEARQLLEEEVKTEKQALGATNSQTLSTPRRD